VTDFHRLICTAAVVCTPILASQACAQGFAAVVSPPRFELAVKPGERIRDVIEISNASDQPAKYRVRTGDWALGPDAGVTFSDAALGPGSCRPWVAIERREILVPSGGRYRYRFEVQPPANTPAGECRFALLIEGDEHTVKTQSGLTVPVSGRIGVIVYVIVGQAARICGSSALPSVTSTVTKCRSSKFAILATLTAGFPGFSAESTPKGNPWTLLLLRYQSFQVRPGLSPWSPELRPASSLKSPTRCVSEESSSGVMGNAWSSTNSSSGERPRHCSRCLRTFPLHGSYLSGDRPGSGAQCVA
jgi:hypothetical protein